MSMKIKFDPGKDIPDLSRKVFCITGGTNGIGKQTIMALSKHSPEHIYFTGRNKTNASNLIEEVTASNPSCKLTFIECDQSSLRSVSDATKEILSKTGTVNVLICNAGVMAIDAGTTQDGYENQFGINQLAHSLFAKRLLPALQAAVRTTGEARVVFTSSNGFRYPPSGGILFESLKSPQKMVIFGRYMRYGQSKLANVVYTSELAKRYPEITSIAVHPGVIWTNLVTSLRLVDQLWVRLTTLGQVIPEHEGAYNLEWAATAKKDNVKSGSFYEPVGVLGPQTKISSDPKLGEELWAWTEEQLSSFDNS
ncbi:hypothetical protein MMC25_007845 [Agyrium rufum]|nr:hypothetical protein [Agyrium rufum]